MTLPHSFIEVHTASLLRVAAHLEAAGSALGPGLDLLRRPGPDWSAAGTALDRTVAEWIGYLTAFGTAVAGTAADLGAVADTYAGAEEAAHHEFTRLRGAEREAGPRWAP